MALTRPVSLAGCNTRPLGQCPALLSPSTAVNLTYRKRDAANLSCSSQALKSIFKPLFATSHLSIKLGACPPAPLRYVSPAAAAAHAADAAGEPAQPQGLFIKKVAGDCAIVLCFLQYSLHARTVVVYMAGCQSKSQWALLLTVL